MTDLDAIVVGAGHNGLAAAAHLSARGWPGAGTGAGSGYMLACALAGR